MSELKQQIEKKAEVGSEIVYSLVENVYDMHRNFIGWEFNQENKEDIEGKWVRLSDVLELVGEYEKEESNIRGALAETTTKLIAKIEYLEREIVNMKEVEKESVCILRKELESARDMSMKADEKLGIESLATHILVDLLDGKLEG